jgi:AraC-like DNA-binding protein
MSHHNTRYPFDNGWRVVFRDMGIAEDDVLLRTGLPRDLLKRQSPTISGTAYYQLWESLEFILRDTPTFPLHIFGNISAEAFSPPLFACLCSANLNLALQRLADYKPLVCPLHMDVIQDAERTTVWFHNALQSQAAPWSLVASELVFMVEMARIATREAIIPQAVYTAVTLPEIDAYAAYLGVPVQHSDKTGLTFSTEDATVPFLTSNDQMWAIFEPQLNKRMRDLAQEPLFRERVRAVLMETIASGQYSRLDVASRLGVSTRTLQRRLKDEGTSYQNELNLLREQLAYNYLSRTTYTSGQIAFLLGYDDPNSFFRAFRSWTGQTPEAVRAEL